LMVGRTSSQVSRLLNELRQETGKPLLTKGYFFDQGVRPTHKAHGFIIKLRTVSKKSQNMQDHQKNHQEQPESFGCWPLEIPV
jgi:DNA-binding transcriptional LysR family regulator